MDAAGAGASMSPAQVRAVFDDDRLWQVGVYVQAGSEQVAWQFAAVLPGLVDAASPDGRLVPVSELEALLEAASVTGARSVGPQKH